MKTARSYSPYLTIWGAQWIVEALLAYFLNLERQSAVVSATLWLAVLLSLLLFALRWTRRRSAAAIVVLRSTSKQPPRDTRKAGGSVSKGLFLIPAVIVLASIGLLLYVQPMSHVLYDLLRALILAFLYSLIGVWLGRELIYLGLWLFTLTAILSIWFLGFAPLVLLFFGGISLLACAAIFHLRGPAQVHAESVTTS